MLKTIVLLFALVAMPAILQAQEQAPATPAQAADKDAPTKPDEKVMHIGGSVTPPVLVHAVDPSISDDMRRERFKGTVKVRLIIEEDGKPSHIQVVRGFKNDFDHSAVTAVSQYRFKPAMQDGKPVKVDLYIDVDFNIF